MDNVVSMILYSLNLLSGLNEKAIYAGVDTEKSLGLFTMRVYISVFIYSVTFTKRYHSIILNCYQI